MCQLLTVVESRFHCVPVVLEHFLVLTSCEGFLKTSQVNRSSCVDQPGFEGTVKTLQVCEIIAA